MLEVGTAPDTGARGKKPLSAVALAAHFGHSAAMEHHVQIRSAKFSDAGHISRLVQNTIRISNAQDYPEAVIERVAANFSTEAIQRLLGNRFVLVATRGEIVVGTASLDGNVVRTVFVAPEVQGSGVGRRLMGAIETTAQGKGTVVIQVPASLTARPFYARLGYCEVQDVFHGGERTVLMEKRIGWASVDARSVPQS